MIIVYFKAKLKEERDAKRSRLDDRHFHIFQIVNDRLGLEKNEVEEACLEGNQVVLKIKDPKNLKSKIKIYFY